MEVSGLNFTPGPHYYRQTTAVSIAHRDGSLKEERSLVPTFITAIAYKSLTLKKKTTF
jgi:hypothetical protein